MAALSEFEAALDELFEGLGRTVTVGGDDITALVDVTDGLAYRMRVLAADAAAVLAVLTVTFEGDVYHVTANGTTSGGVVSFDLQRHEQESEYSGQFNLRDEQAGLS